jgi:hypothetical protein
MSRSFLAALLFGFLLLSTSAWILSCPQTERLCVDRDGTIHGHGSGDLTDMLNVVAAQAREMQRSIDEKETNAFLRRIQREVDRVYYEMQRACPQGRPE